MCGLAGYIGNKINLPSSKKIIDCRASLKNRGPDASGVVKKSIDGKSLLFIHTRLSIIDLNKNSSQPFSDDYGTLIFNGMIYNYV